MCLQGALLVGSYAKYVVGEDVKPSDYDLLVPFIHWQIIAPMVPENATPNRFGGWRFDDQGNQVDVWPGDVQHYLQTCKSKYGGQIYAVDYVHNVVYSSKVVDLRDMK